jgi:hypothetical protein
MTTKNQGVVGRATAASVQTTTSAITSAADVILVAYVAAGGNFTTWADNQSNTYTSEATYSPSNDPTTDVEVRRCKNVTNGPTQFTVSNDSFRDTALAVYDVSGLSSAAADTPVNAAFSSASPTTTITTSVANEFIIGLIIHTGDNDASHTAGSGWTKDGPTDVCPASFESQIGATATTYNVDMTLSGSNVGNIFAIAFRPAAAGGGKTLMTLGVG